jgi:hypothetical protein
VSLIVKVWLKSLAYPSGEEGGKSLVQMISTCLRYTQRRGGGDPRPVLQPPHNVYSLSRYFGRKVQLGAANKRQKLGLVWRNRKKISQIINDYLCLPFFLLIILGLQVQYCQSFQILGRELTYSIRYGTLEVRRIFVLNFTFSREQLKNIFSGLTITGMALSNKSPIPSIYLCHLYL